MCYVRNFVSLVKSIPGICAVNNHEPVCILFCAKLNCLLRWPSSGTFKYLVLLPGVISN